MTEAVFGKIRDALFKAYALAGLLPAAVLILCLVLYIGGPAAAQSIPAKIVGKPAQVAWLIAGWLALGLVFFALRAPLLSAFDGVPTGRIGQWLVDRRLSRRMRCDHRRREAEWAYTVANWHTLQFKARMATFKPDGVVCPPLPDALKGAAAGRQRLEEAIKSGDCPSRRVRTEIFGGMRMLFLAAGAHDSGEQPAGLEAEIARWEALRQQRSALEIMQIIADDTKRFWIAAHAKGTTFPSGAWVHPTHLGNRLSALNDYAEARYGIDTTTLWTRLWWALPEAAKDEVSDAKLGVDACMTLAAAFTFVAAIPLIAYAGNCATGSCWLDVESAIGQFIWIAAFLAIAYAVYRSAAVAVDGLSSKLRTLIDMNRLSVLTTMGYHPATIAEEIEMFGELRKFFTQAAPRDKRRTLTIEPQHKEKEDEDK